MMNIVLGSGAAGISAAFHLKKNGKKVIVFAIQSVDIFIEYF